MSAPALLTDLYQLTMLQAYFAERMSAPAVFELFVRRLPARRNFLVAAGLQQLLDELQGLSVRDDELTSLRALGWFDGAFLEWLGRLRFTGDVDALREGTIFFAEEPIVRVTAPVAEAQLVETRLINLIHFQTGVASKAARLVLAADGRKLVDFGLRRAHGAEAGLLAARAAYLAGFAATSNVEAGLRFRIPLAGTMAHSFVQAHDDERAAFVAFARANPRATTFLVDTYDTEAAVAHLVALARSDGLSVAGVRLDSGDLADHARHVRAILDGAGLSQATIFASGNLDEDRIAALVTARAPIDGFGVGSALTTIADAPYLDCAYKLQEYAGRPRRKRSEGKATWPGRKQVWRRFEEDLVTLDGERTDGEPLLEPVMRSGRIVRERSLEAARAHCAAQLSSLPPRLRALSRAEPAYRVRISQAVRRLADEVDRGIAPTRT